MPSVPGLRITQLLLVAPCASFPHADGQQLNAEEQRRGAEELLCILSVLEGILSQLPSLDSLGVKEIVGDLIQLMNKTSYIMVGRRQAAAWGRELL